MAETTTELRYGFGRNWQRFVNRYLDEDRIAIAQRELLSNLQLSTLKGLSFLDIGSGSGIHSLAALRAGAERVVSFDYDMDAVQATRSLREAAGAPAHWTVTSGSVLDAEFLATLGLADIVYSWGVLHHTGQQWRALDNVFRTVKPGGQLSIALYNRDMCFDPPWDFWLDVKQRYNRSSPLRRRRMEIAYIWYMGLKSSWRNLPALWRQARQYRRHRGMAYYTDVCDWLGGWPMEFSTLSEVLGASSKNGFALERLRTGEFCSEYLFRAPLHSEPATGLAAYFRSVGTMEELASIGKFHLSGTGAAARQLLEAARRHGCAPLGVFDRERRGSWEGYEIQPETELANHNDVPVVVASSYFGDIVERLTALGCRQVIDAFPIIVQFMRAEGEKKGPPERRFRWLL